MIEEVSSLKAVGAGPAGRSRSPQRDISRLGSPPRACPSGGRPRGAAPTLPSAEGRLREIPHYSSILSFHHSAPNKPNFGPARRKDKCRVDKELRRMGHGRGCGKTKPISGLRIADFGLATDLPPPACSGDPTNPISGSRAWVRHSWALAPMLRDTLRRHYEQGFCAKQTQFWTRAIWRISVV